MSHGHRHRLVQRMSARDPREDHRVSTPLELLFDLCVVVAVAQAASHLHHGLAAGHLGHALGAYGLVFFALWWAWMNFSWFASAYDTDDVPYRLTTLIQIAGVLVIAAGIGRGFEQQDFTLVTIGYATMRVGLVIQWLRAARAHPEGRRTALRYAIGLVIVQLGWLSLLFVPASAWLIGWAVMAPAELVVPPWAERAGSTTWHPHHISERYGLLTLIVLGESVLSATTAIQGAMESGHVSAQLLAVIGGGVVILFAMWWVYFDRPVHALLSSNKVAFLWGYGHLLIFSAAAAVGVGIGVSADFASGHAPISAGLAGAAIAGPVLVYGGAVWLLQLRPLKCGPVVDGVFVVAGALIVASSRSAWAVPLIAVITAAVVTAVVVMRQRAEHGHPHGGHA